MIVYAIDLDINRYTQAFRRIYPQKLTLDGTSFQTLR